VNEPKIPCFVLIDEAYQLNVSEVKRISGIGRGRGVGLGLGYQDLPQMYDQYGREQANAILGTVMTKIFLPGLDDVTAEYASKQLGDTTIFAKTYQDFPGKKSDNVRYAEQKRVLMHAGEVRQIAAHKELLIVNDTAPPIKAAYPPMAVLRDKFTSPEYSKPDVLYLGDIDARYNFGEDITNMSEFVSEIPFSNAKSGEINQTITDEQIARIVDKSVSEVIGENIFLPEIEKSEKVKFDDYLTDDEDIASRISETSESGSGTSKKPPIILSKIIESKANPKSTKSKIGKFSDALNGLSDEVRAVQSEIYDRSLLEINRSVI
jgi:hypothetical protein